MAHDSVRAPKVRVQQHARRTKADPPSPPHMPGGSVVLGKCGMISTKIPEGGGGMMAHDSMQCYDTIWHNGRLMTCDQGTHAFKGFLR